MKAKNRAGRQIDLELRLVEGNGPDARGAQLAMTWTRPHDGLTCIVARNLAGLVHASNPRSNLSLVHWLAFMATVTDALTGAIDKDRPLWRVETAKSTSASVRVGVLRKSFAHLASWYRGDIRGL